MSKLQVDEKLNVYMSEKATQQMELWKHRQLGKLRDLIGKKTLPKTYDKCNEWWLTSALPNLCSLTHGEKQELEVAMKTDPTIAERVKVQNAAARSRIWDMGAQSCMKLDAVESIAVEVCRQFSEAHIGQSIVRTISVAVLGSVSRMEAEIYSDVDVDVLFSSTSSTEPTYQSLLHDELKREMSSRSSRLLHDSGISALIKDVRVYPYSQIEEELKSGHYDHVSKLLLEATFVVKAQNLQNRIRRWANTATDEGMIAERKRWIDRRFDELSEDLKRGELYPESSRFHMLATFYCQVLALEQDNRKLAKQPYWMIADALIQKWQHSGEHGKADLLRQVVNKTIQAREVAIMRSKDIFEIERYLAALEALTGIRVRATPVPGQPKLV